MMAQEIEMEMEKQRKIEALRSWIVASAGAMASLRDAAKESGTLHLFPMFNDPMIQRMLETVDEMDKLRRS